MFNRAFQNGDRIIPLHGALVNSNFDRLNSPPPDFHDFLNDCKCHRPLGLRTPYFGSAELLKIVQGTPWTLFKHIIFWNLKISKSRNQQHGHIRADKSLSSVLADLEHLEYGINIFRKPGMNILGFSIQFKEALQRTHSPRQYKWPKPCRSLMIQGNLWQATINSNYCGHSIGLIKTWQKEDDHNIRTWTLALFCIICQYLPLEHGPLRDYTLFCKRIWTLALSLHTGHDLLD